ncbi:MAG: hypothetical protein ACLFMM_09710 [Methanohalobium sp.]|uniref:hypothetical protein n=1 Tax=Methanohalobium sp. TaxID=2837493 RepID=UPI00397B2526
MTASGIETDEEHQDIRSEIKECSTGVKDNIQSRVHAKEMTPGSITMEISFLDSHSNQILKAFENCGWTWNQ